MKNRDIEEKPHGIDGFTDNKLHNINDNEIKAYKNAHIKTKIMLINRKMLHIKGANKPAKWMKIERILEKIYINSIYKYYI